MLEVRDDRGLKFFIMSVRAISNNYKLGRSFKKFIGLNIYQY